jgi:hypothetical protein
VRSRNEAPDLEEQQGLEIGKGVFVIGDYWQQGLEIARVCLQCVIGDYWQLFFLRVEMLQSRAKA